MKKFIIDKGSIDNFIRQVESQSRFTFTRKINRDLMAAITEIIENGLINHQQTFRTKIGNKIEYIITLSTKNTLKTIDIAVTNAAINQPLCQESYLMPTKTLLPFTFKEITRSLLTLSPLLACEQLETLIQTAISKNSAMTSAPGGVGIIMDFQNDVLTCTMFSDEEIIHTLHFFVPKESIELGLNPTLYRYLSVDFTRFEGIADKQKTQRSPASLEGLVAMVSEESGVEEGKVVKLLHKLLYNTQYDLGEISAVVIGGTMPEVIFSVGEKSYSTHLDNTLISEIVTRSGDKYKTALRDSLIESSRKKQEVMGGTEHAAPEKPSLLTKRAEKKPAGAPVSLGAPTGIDMSKGHKPQQALHKKKLTDYQLETLLETLKHLDKPEQAYDEIIKFIGDEVEFRGKITHKEMLVIYHFSHERNGGDDTETELKIDIKINRLGSQQAAHGKRLFCFTVDAKRSDIDLISGAFNYLRNMFN